MVRDMRCCCEWLLFCTGNCKALGYICAMGESVRFGGENSRRRATGQIVGDSGRRSQTGEAKIRAETERNFCEKSQEGIIRLALATLCFLRIS